MKNYSIYITENLIRFAQTIINPQNQTALKEQEINIASLKQDEIFATLKNFLRQKRVTPEYLALCIPRPQATIRYLDLPSIDEREISQMIGLKLKHLFPYKPEEMIFDYAVIQKSPEGSANVMVAAVVKEAVLKQLSVLRQAGLAPDAIGISSIFLFNQFCQEKRIPGNYLLINFDDGFMDIMQISEGRLTFSRGANFSGTLDKEEFLKTLGLTVSVLIGDKGDKIDEIILSGKGVDLADFARRLEGAWPYKVEIDETLNVAKGSLLSGTQDALSINLLPEEFKTRQKKEKRERALFYLLTLLLLNLSLIANIVFLQIRAREEYLSLLKAEVKKIDLQTSVLQDNMLRLQVFQNYLHSSRLTLGMVSELYRLAPEGVYLNSLSISRKKPSGTMVIIGQARDAQSVSKFAHALKKSPFVTKADINYITKKSLPAQAVVEFKISAAL